MTLTTTILDPEQLKTAESCITTESQTLMLWNDDINTFDHVITCLVKHLKKKADDAVMIAWQVHTKGKAILKKAPRHELVEYYNILKLKGLTVSIE